MIFLKCVLSFKMSKFWRFVVLQFYSLIVSSFVFLKFWCFEILKFWSFKVLMFWSFVLRKLHLVLEIFKLWFIHRFRCWQDNFLSKSKFTFSGIRQNYTLSKRRFCALKLKKRMLQMYPLPLQINYLALQNFLRALTWIQFWRSIPLWEKIIQIQLIYILLRFTDFLNKRIIFLNF